MTDVEVTFSLTPLTKSNFPICKYLLRSYSKLKF